jgi:chromosome segregation ATPase
MSSIKSMLKTIRKNKYSLALSNSEESLSTMSNETSITYLDHEFIGSNSNLLNCSQLLEDDMRTNLMAEMQSENMQYKQMICDLKEQLHNAEETFTQLANEIDCHLRKIAVLSKSNEDYSIKLNVKMEENDLLTREFEELKQQLVEQNERNLTLNEQLKEFHMKYKHMDDDLSSLNQTYEKNRFEIQLLLKQLNEKNVRKFFCCRFFF